MATPASREQAIYEGAEVERSSTMGRARELRPLLYGQISRCIEIGMEREEIEMVERGSLMMDHHQRHPLSITSVILLDGCRRHG
jgi:hypothetical protein